MSHASLRAAEAALLRRSRRPAEEAEARASDSRRCDGSDSRGAALRRASPPWERRGSAQLLLARRAEPGDGSAAASSACTRASRSSTVLCRRCRAWPASSGGSSIAERRSAALERGLGCTAHSGTARDAEISAGRVPHSVARTPPEAVLHALAAAGRGAGAALAVVDATHLTMQAQEAVPASPPPAHAAASPRVVSPHFAPSPPSQAALDPALAALEAYVLGLGGAPLPPGWRVEVRTRATGASAGHTDAYFISPAGVRLRSRAEVARMLGLSPSAAAAPQRARRDSPQPAARVLSPFFAVSPPQTTPKPPAKRPRVATAAFSPARRVAGRSSWEPPASPYGLIQETLYSDPWKVLVACICLNKTSCAVVRTLIWELFQLVPTPEAALAVPEDAILRIIRPLGLSKRAGYIKRLSEQYLRDDWRVVTELAGCGKYASDAYALFVSGDWREVQPEDKELKKYKAFLLDTDGRGRGLTRDLPPPGIVI